MANIPIFKGGVNVPNYMWHSGDYPLSGPPFAPAPWSSDAIPRFNAQVDGAFNLKDYALGYPLIPKDFEWQRRALVSVAAVGDIIQMIVVPCNHYVDFLRFDVASADEANASATPPYLGLTGLTAALTAQRVEWNFTTRQFDFTEIPDITAALTAQSLPASIPLDVPSSTFVSLLRVDSGYVQPLYVEPLIGTTAPTPPATAGLPYWLESGAVILGLKITALPAGISLVSARNSFFLAARIRAFDCPAGL